VNSALGTASDGSPSAVMIRKVKEAELDEMWSFVGSKKQPRWLWEALDHETGRVVAYAFGRREDRALLLLKALRARLAFAVFTPTAGGPIAGTWIPIAMW
jgi:hypothetical protein